jgi:hypothetical protein
LLDITTCADYIAKRRRENMKNTAILFTLFLVGCSSSTTVNPDYDEYEPGEGGSAGETYVETGGTDPVSTGGNDPVSTGGNDPVSTGGTGNVTETGGTAGTAGTGGITDDTWDKGFDLPESCKFTEEGTPLDQLAGSPAGTCNAYRGSSVPSGFFGLYCSNPDDYPTDTPHTIFTKDFSGYADLLIITINEIGDGVGYHCVPQKYILNPKPLQ